MNVEIEPAQIESRGDAHVRSRVVLTNVGRFGILVVAFWVFIALFGGLISPFDQADFVSDDSFLAASGKFLLGTDYLGRDILSRLLYGTRLTLGMALAATALASFVGSTLGFYAAIKGGMIDAVICRLNDALLSFPTIMMALVIVAALGSSIPVLICTTALVYSCGIFRIARALGMDIKALDYVEVACGRGESTVWILFQEILPNAVVPLIVDFGMRLSFAILFMSGLSFLGLGVQPPDADWGSMVRENMAGLSTGSLAPIIPALAIASLTIGLNLIIDDFSACRGRGLAKRML